MADNTKAQYTNKLAAMIPQIMNAIGGGDTRTQQMLEGQRQQNEKQVKENNLRNFMRAVTSPDTGEITDQTITKYAELFNVNPQDAMRGIMEFDAFRKSRKPKDQTVSIPMENGQTNVQQIPEGAPMPQGGIPGLIQGTANKPPIAPTPKGYGSSGGRIYNKDNGNITHEAPVGKVDPYEGLAVGYETFLRANKLPNNKANYDQYQENVVKNKKALKNTAGKWPNLADLMAQGWMPSGRVTGPQMDAFEAASERAIERGEPLTVKKLRDMEFMAVRNRATGSTAGGRLVLSRKQNIEAANGLIKDMRVVSKKLNYSPVKFIGKLEKFKNGQLNDPIFTEYMTQRADSLFILGNALKQNGLTDKSIEVEEESFSPTLTPQAFDAWMNVQVRALNRAAHEMNTDFKYNIEMNKSFPAGQGGAPTKENPTPTKPKNIKFMGFE